MTVGELQDRLQRFPRNYEIVLSDTQIEERKIFTKNITVIENGVSIGNNVVIHPNVKIGEGAVICNNSEIVQDVKPWSTYSPV